jgi:hypothetical protein
VRTHVVDGSQVASDFGTLNVRGNNVDGNFQIILPDGRIHDASINTRYFHEYRAFVQGDYDPNLGSVCVSYEAIGNFYTLTLPILVTGATLTTTPTAGVEYNQAVFRRGLVLIDQSEIRNVSQTNNGPARDIKTGRFYLDGSNFSMPSFNGSIARTFDLTKGKFRGYMVFYCESSSVASISVAQGSLLRTAAITPLPIDDSSTHLPERIFDTAYEFDIIGNELVYDYTIVGISGKEVQVNNARFVPAGFPGYYNFEVFVDIN